MIEQLCAVSASIALIHCVRVACSGIYCRFILPQVCAHLAGGVTLAMVRTPTCLCALRRPLESTCRQSAWRVTRAGWATTRALRIAHCRRWATTLACRAGLEAGMPLVGITLFHNALSLYWVTTFVSSVILAHGTQTERMRTFRPVRSRRMAALRSGVCQAAQRWQGMIRWYQNVPTLRGIGMWLLSA